MENRYFLPSAKLYPIQVKSAKGSYLYDHENNAYLDCLSGIGVNALGHQHEAINSAIMEQMNKNLHLFGYFLQDVHNDLAKLLIDATHFDRLFLANSGTESIEGCLKIVKKWGNQNNRNEIICFEGSFHGRSLGALSITAQAAKQKVFEPLLPGIKAIQKTEEAILTNINENTTAVFMELISGEGGIVPTSHEFINALMKLKEKYGFLLVIDEIQSGIGRTGKLFSYQHYGIEPDLVATAKGIGGGLPLGAILMTDAMAHVLGPGEHGSTFGGNPLACATGRAVLRELLENGLLAELEKKSEYFRRKFENLNDKYPGIIKDIRIIGLMIGIEVGDKAPDILAKCIENHLIVNATQGHTIRFLPPFTISFGEIDEAVEKFEKAISF